MSLSNFVLLSTLITIPTVLSQVSIKAPNNIIAAFDADGFNVVNTVQYGNGMGVAALHRNATINNSTNYKTAYWVSGSAYEMGYCLGQIAEPSITAMTGVYLEHIVPSMISPEIDELLQNSSLAPIYDVLITALEDLLINDTIKYFNTSLNIGAIDMRLVDEMKGLTDGALSVNPNSTVTYNKIMTLNYGYDMLLALIYTGEILNLLNTSITEKHYYNYHSLNDNQKYFLHHHLFRPGSGYKLFKPPVYCNAFTITGEAIQGGKGSFMGRDFMFALGEVFQDYVSPTIYIPSDERKPIVSVAAPGFIGSMVAMNTDGFMMGVDVLQAEVANTTIIGINSLLLVRQTAHYSSTSAEGTAYVRQQIRGVPWIYPMSDATGDGRILETVDAQSALNYGGQNNPPVWPDFRPVVDDVNLRNLLPSSSQIQAMVGFIDYSDGVWSRNTTAKLSPEKTLIPQYNPILYQFNNETYNTSAWGPRGYVFPSYQAEQDAYTKIQQKWFSPERVLRNDLVIGTNFAVVPSLRIAAMGFWTSLDGMGAPQFRYDGLLDTILQTIEQNNGISYDMMEYVITYLDRIPGYYGATVDGIMAVGDLQNKIIRSKGGYWIDAFVQTTLPAYMLPPSNNNNNDN